MFHGGSNWGFMAGANSEANSSYMPDITSYEYGSPVDEQGRATPTLHGDAPTIGILPAGRETLPDIPEPIPAMRMPEIEMARWTISGITCRRRSSPSRSRLSNRLARTKA